MRRKIFLAVPAIALAILASPLRSAGAEPPESVTVTNFPDVQQVSGKVVVTEPIPQTRFETRKALVSPADPGDANHWTEAGVLDVSGFTHVTLSLAGSLQGSAQAGTVGVVLVPDVPEILNALRSNGVVQLGLRADATLNPAQGGLFSSEPVTLRLGFPRYRVFLYNSTAKTAEAAVYAYLGTS
jgi:hypothetical protein